ncbi:type VII secretion protein EccE [Phytohabitans sp. ZYX-F-186]|uniref:Type VII secretion protein EccE n=1 Tax=Phytohabitans maris TaxID=3071409 RepID=A0ABU0ZJI7_9ACTN|nr:type VII secretion protein EccE [Phytohabitans sp. ZYX-F-186]MDQ7906564.1 type VII secretion protein EccE [Phytohabitans sp. ZYX-F-186]
MTVSPQTMSPHQVRAVARVASESPDSSGPAILIPRRRPGHLGPVHITQLLLAEVVVVGILASVTSEIVTLIAGVALAGIMLLLVTLGRRNGRWWLERRMMTRSYRRRRLSSTASPYGDDPRLGALRRLAPDLVVEDVSVADGAHVGVARDDAGWYAVAAVTSSAPMRDEPGPIPLEALAAALGEADQPGAVLQVVTQTVPAPSLDMHPSSAAGQSYRQLLARFGAVPVPADRSTWVAVRLDARTLAEAVADGDADLDIAPAVVAALIRRVAKSLRRVGVSHRLLDADELLEVLLRSCDLAPTTQSAEPVQPREDWSEWHSSRLAHRSYWIRGWPPVDQAAALLDWLTTAPASMTSLSLIMAPDDDKRLMDLRGLVRVAAPAEQLAQVSQAIRRGAEQAKADLFPLDGEQGPAVYASAPTGGGAR